MIQEIRTWISYWESSQNLPENLQSSSAILSSTDIDTGEVLTPDNKAATPDHSNPL